MRIVAGKYGSRPLKSPKTDATRPTQDKIKGAIFSSLGNLFDGGNFLDCYSGTGNMGLEAISRGMDHATLIDNNKMAISIIKENVKSLDVKDQTSVISGNVFNVLERLDKKYDIIYIDPPYRKQQNEKLIEKLTEYNLVNEDGIIVIESLQEEVWPETISIYTKYKEKTYGITRISYYKKEETK
jgi:16S rRNA (guanine966-N2)-methyltransferase